MPELNYSVSQYQATETSGDNFDTGAGTGAGQLTTQMATLVITPDSGFTVSANDFSIGGATPTVVFPAGGNNSAIYFYQAFDSNVSLPSEVIQVSFVNSVVGGSVANNVVNVNVTFVDDFVMPSNNITINIDIDGDAKPILPEIETQVGTVISYNLLDAGYVGDTVANSTRIPTNSGNASVNQTGVISGYTFSAGDENIQNIILEGTYGVNGSSQTTYSNNVGVFPENAAEQPSSGFDGNDFQIKSNRIFLGQPADTITSINEGTIASSVFWTIKPLPGYVVSASDFAQVNMDYISSVSSSQPYVTPSAIPQPSCISSNQFGVNNSSFNPLFNADFPETEPFFGASISNPYTFYSQNNQLQNPDSLDSITQWNQGGGNVAIGQTPLVFSNTSTPYSANNRVVVTYTNQSDLIVDGSFSSLNSSMAFAGRAQQVIPGTSGMPAIDINSYVNIVNPNSNGGTATVTGLTNTGLYGTVNTTSVTSVVENGGFTNEATVYSISGTVPESRSTVIATIRIDADTNKYFLNAPSLTRDSVLRANNVNTNDIIKLSINSVERTNNKATAYILDVKYKNNVATTSVDNLKLNLNYKLQTIVTISSLINRIIYGKDRINNIGEYRQITLKGKASTPFVLTLNKALHSEGVIGFESGSEVRDTIIDTNGDSILNKRIATSTLIKTDGGRTRSINSTIGANGKYTFNQRFPELPIVLETLVNGAITVATKTLVLDTTVGVEVGDQIFFSSMRKSASIKVTSVTNTTTLVLSETITIADNLVVKFKRSTSYHLNITPSTSLASNIPTTTPTYVLNQYVNPIITLRASTASHLYKINAQDLPGHGSIRQQYDIIYGGKPNSVQSYDTVFPTTTTGTISYLLDSESSKVFSAARAPFWSKSVPYDALGTVASNVSVGSDWEVDRKINYNISDKYSEIQINNIAITATGGETITITFKVIINQFGARDTVYDLDLDKIVTIS
jgi:hypothetical protein